MKLLFLPLFFLSFSSFAQTGNSGMDESLTTEKRLGLTLLHQKAPVFVDTTLSGNIFDLARMKDTVVILNFWFIGCKSCHQEIPYLNRLQEDFKGKKFKLISVALDTRAEFKPFQDSVSAKVKLKNDVINYDIIPNCKRLSEMYFVYAYPTTFLIKNGKVQKLLFNPANIGEDGYKNWVKVVDDLL